MNVTDQIWKIFMGFEFGILTFSRYDGFDIFEFKPVKIQSYIMIKIHFY